MDQDLQTTLRNLPFLDEVSSAHVELLASVASVKDFPAGIVIFREGQEASQLYLIVRGAISLEICTPGIGCVRFQTVGAGDFLGWSPLLHIEAMTATARVIEPTSAILLDPKQLAALFEQHPRFGYEFMCRIALVLSHRLGATRLQLFEACSGQMPLHADVEVTA
jgi:CRP/FNR family transcriptional regulator, cyclic AMP receptor protein